MSKELEALDYVWYNYYTEELSQDEVEEIEKNLNIVQDGLKRLEAIDNSNPNEALDYMESLFNCWEYLIKKDNSEIKEIELEKYTFKENYDTIKNHILKAQEQEEDIIHYKGTVDNLRRDNALLKDIKNKQEKVLEIIKEKYVEIYILFKSKNVEQYNFNIRFGKKLTQEEFDTLKEMLGDE